MAASRTEEKLEKDTVTITLSNQEFYCALTKKLLVNPVSLSCSHFAEKSAPLTDCSICQKQVTVSKTPPLFFKTLLEAATKTNPHLKEEKPGKETCTFEVDKKEFICPVGSHIFCIPLELECGHMLEMFEAAFCIITTENHSCPLCRTPFPNPSPNAFFNKMFDIVLKLNPSFADERYLPYDVARHIDRLELVPLLIKFPKLLDHFYEDLQGLSVLCVLLRAHNCKTLTEHPELVENISIASLNNTSKTDNPIRGGKNALCMLTKYFRGQDLLRDHPSLRAKITVEGFNTIIIEHNETPVLDLVSTSTGIEILHADPLLRDKINSIGLNTTSNFSETKDVSALYLLAKQPRGRELLLSDKKLRDKILPSGLNSVTKTGMSAAFILAKECISLFEDETLRAKVDMAALSKLCAEQKEPHDLAKKISDLNRSSSSCSSCLFGRDKPPKKEDQDQNEFKKGMSQ